MIKSPNELQWLLPSLMKRHGMDTVELHRRLCERDVDLSPRSVRRLAAAKSPAITLALLEALRRIFRCSIGQLIGLPQSAADKVAVAPPAATPAPAPAVAAKPPTSPANRRKQAKPPAEKIEKPLFPFLPVAALPPNAARIVHIPRKTRP